MHLYRLIQTLLFGIPCYLELQTIPLVMPFSHLLSATVKFCFPLEFEITGFSCINYILIIALYTVFLYLCLSF